MEDHNENTYPVGFRFELSFQGEDAAFQEVSGISQSVDIEEITGGGENRFKYRLPKVSTFQNLVLKRALVPKGSKLIAWCSGILDNGFAEPISVKDITVSLLDQAGKIYKKWTVYDDCMEPADVCLGHGIDQYLFPHDANYMG